MLMKLLRLCEDSLCAKDLLDALLQGFMQLSLIGRQRLVNAYFGVANPALPVSSSLDTS